MKRTGLAALALPTSVLVATLWIAIACGTSSVSSAPPSQQAGAGPGSPDGTIGASVLPTGSPNGGQVPASSQDPNAPPTGLLSVAGASTQGMFGSYCWTVAGTSTCVDSAPFTDSGPDLPNVTLAASDTQLQFSLANGFPFAAWTASYVDDNGKVVALGGAGSSFDPDVAHPSISPATTAVFPPPPPHDQSIVQVFVRFADGGDASYGWNVTVP